MKLWQAILADVTKKYGREIMELDIEKLFEKECYVMLERIREILEDNSLDDKECFQRIESIVCLFEEIGSDCGARHDFG